MINHEELHKLTHVVIERLDIAFRKHLDHSTEGLILSALVSAKLIHDQFAYNAYDLDPEEYCAAV
ncbi:MAG TPA: hypothetical protein HPP94_09205 [Desulfuromonadales bacterium]|nr:hypothetical protein [Desulfuromonadales bacterium]